MKNGTIEDVVPINSSVNNIIVLGAYELLRTEFLTRVANNSKSQRFAAVVLT